MAEDAISELRVSSMLAISGGYFPYPSIPLAKAYLKTGNTAEARRLLESVLTSPIYQPLEHYRAHKMLRELDS